MLGRTSATSAWPRLLDAVPGVQNLRAGPPLRVAGRLLRVRLRSGSRLVGGLLGTALACVRAAAAFIFRSLARSDSFAGVQASISFYDVVVGDLPWLP